MAPPPRLPRPRRVALPGGARGGAGGAPGGFPPRAVWAVSRRDLPVLAREAGFGAGAGPPVYLRRGVALGPGDAVLDVGANVGLFALAAWERVGPRGRVVACEPVPPLAEALRRNLAAAGAPAADVLECGLADGAAASAAFTFYPGCAGWSTLAALEDPEEVARGVEAFLERELRAPPAPGARGGPGPPPEVRLARALKAALPARLYLPLQRRFVRRLLRGGLRVEARLRTVSDVLRSHDLRQVDLLKVDVERAEAAVLAGVDAGDWPRIRQVALEAHAGPGLERCLALLRGPGGFPEVVVEPAGTNMEEAGLFNVYARRPAPAKP